MQHLAFEDLGRGAVAEALAGRIVVRPDDLGKALFRKLSEIRLPGKEAAQPADGVLDSPLLPWRVGVAEEGLDAEVVELVMTGELGAVVEGDRLAKR